MVELLIEYDFTPFTCVNIQIFPSRPSLCNGGRTETRTLGCCYVGAPGAEEAGQGAEAGADFQDFCVFWEGIPA